MDNIIESSSTPLVTPEFNGTDDEKLITLQYWSELVSLLRTLNVSVPAHDNKIAIIAQLKKEVEYLELEYTNATAAPVQGPDGETTLEKVPTDNAVDLSTDEIEPTSAQSTNYPRPSPFTPHRPLTSDQARKLAGIR